MRLPLELLMRGILCNWLVCLALWMSARTKSDAAKCILIFWCLFAFIASGFEHSVANMTLFAIALFGNHPDTVTIGGMFYNLLWVSIGNIIAGVVFMAAAYWQANGRNAARGSAGSARRGAGGMTDDPRPDFTARTAALSRRAGRRHERGACRWCDRPRGGRADRTGCAAPRSPWPGPRRRARNSSTRKSSSATSIRSMPTSG